MEKDYHIKKITTHPQDLGFHAVNRARDYFLLIHKKKGQFVTDPVKVYQKLVDRLSANQSVTIDSLFWESDPSELRRELLGSVTDKRLSESESPDPQGAWSNCLTDWEKGVLETYITMWQEKHGDLKGAVFNLSQNPESHRQWSACTDGLPTMPTLCHGLSYCIFISIFIITPFRRPPIQGPPKMPKSGKAKPALMSLRLKGSGVTHLWHACKQRWATAREKPLGYTYVYIYTTNTIYIYVFIYAYIYLYIYFIYIYAYICIYIYTFKYIYKANMHTRINIFRYLHVFMFACMYIFVN